MVAKPRKSQTGYLLMVLYIRRRLASLVGCGYCGMKIKWRLKS